MKLTVFGILFLILSQGFAANTMYGLFMVVKGDIKVTNLQNQTAAVKVGTKVFPGETVISGADSRAKIVMSDRNVFNISPSTTFALSKYENDPKSGAKEVELNLVDGKVRSNVEQIYDGEKSKFQIKTPTAVAGVRGTQFLVSFDSQTKMTQVVTLKGSVEFSSVSTTGQASKSVTVKKGEMTSTGAESTVPEAPKTLPKEELKKIDSESSAQTAGKSKETAPNAQNDNTGKPSDKNKNGREAAADGLPKPPATMIDKSDMGATVSNSTVIDAPTMAPPVVVPPTVQMPKPPATALPPPPPNNVPITGGNTKVILTPVPK